MTDYQGRVFKDSWYQDIVVDETLSLRDALDQLAGAHLLKKYAYEMRSAAGGPAFKDAEDQVTRYRRISDVARANAEAAFFRTTGRWPGEMYDLGLR